jgi:hypothetical protein
MKQAKQIEAQLLAEVGAGRHQRSAMTLAHLLDEWLTWRESNGKPISPASNARTGGGKLSASRIRDVHAILSGALGLAARWGYVPFNAALLARPPAPRNAARRQPTAEQARVLMAAAAKRDPEFELLCASVPLPGRAAARWWRCAGATWTWTAPSSASRATCCSCAAW